MVLFSPPKLRPALKETSYKWTEEDPSVEVARRKLEQGGTALFIREQAWAQARTQRVPWTVRARRTLQKNWLLFRYRGYLFNHATNAARARCSTNARAPDQQTR